MILISKKEGLKSSEATKKIDANRTAWGNVKGPSRKRKRRKQKEVERKGKREKKNIHRFFEWKQMDGETEKMDRKRERKKSGIEKGRKRNISLKTL